MDRRRGLCALRCAVFLAWLVAVSAVGAEIFEESWSFVYDTPTYGETLNRVELDAAGNVYTAGGAGLFKLDPRGQQTWRIAGRASLFAVNAAGDSYAAMDEMTPDAAIVRYDAGGTLVWRWTDPEILRTYLGPAVLDAAGGLVVVATTILDNSMGMRAEVIRLDDSGTTAWKVVLAEGQDAFLGDLRLDRQGNALASVSNGSASSLTKLDPAGAVLWQVACPGSCFSVTVDSAGSAFVLHEDGVTKFDANGQEVRQVALAAPASSLLTIDRFDDVIVAVAPPYPSTEAGAFVKFRNDLEILWTTPMAAGQQTVTDIETDDDGRIYASAYRWFMGWAQRPRIVSYKLSPTGEMLFYEMYPDVYHGYGMDIAVGPDETFYVAGTTWEHTSAYYGGIVIKYAPRRVVPVSIDIKPGDVPNSIHLGSRGTVPVAILSTSTFDARTIDSSTVTLAGAPVQLRGRGIPMASAEDVNQDGLPDLVIHVTTESLRLTDADTEAVLEGRTFDGVDIRGADSVRVVR